MNKIIELRTSEIKNYADVHYWLAAKLQLPDYYGHNLDSLWDCVSGAISLPVTVLWYDDAEVSDQYTSITNLFEEAAGEIDDFEFGYIEDENGA